MAEEKYNLVFSGELAKGAQLQQTKENVGKLFKVSGATLDKLFSGKPITLKKNLDFDTATKYRVAIKKAGALVTLQEIPAASAVKPAVTGKAQFGVPEPSHEVSQSAGSTSAVPAGESQTPDRQVLQGAPSGGVEEAVASQVTVDVPSVEIAAVGVRLSDGAEPVDAVNIDVSNISLRAAEGNLVDDSERARVEPVEVDVSGLEMGEVGDSLLKPEERKQVEAVSLDLSEYHVAEKGERLSEESAPPPPAPDVSHIQLEK